MTALLEMPVDEDASPRAATQWLTLLQFHIGPQSYALPIGEIQEILPMVRLARPPAAPEILAGMLEMGDWPIPVVQLSRLFDLPAPVVGLYTPILILRSVEHPMALLVEKVDQIVSVTHEAILPVRESHSFNGCAIGMVGIGGETALLLSTDRILVEQERDGLEALAARMHQRLSNLTEIER